jgi:galactokinase
MTTGRGQPAGLHSDLREALRRFAAWSPGPAENVRVFFAPGRVNLIGEHLDYNGGLVFPAALTLGTWAVVRPRSDGVLRFASTRFPEIACCRTDQLSFDAGHGFANYPKGALWALQSAGLPVVGADFLFASNLPSGSGLSSSAAIEVVTAAAMAALTSTRIEPSQLALLAQRAENEFVGVQCGIMDQFAVAAGREGHAMLLDCATLQCEWVPLRLGDARIVVSDTHQVRGLADSAYNQRRRECEAALAALRRVRPGLRTLAEVLPEAFADLESAIEDPTVRKRARHVVTEQARVKAAARCVAAGDVGGFGALLNQSHESLRDDYEVTGPALDALAEAAWTAPGCYGSRMTGAGFGGCTISLVAADKLEEFQVHVAQEFQRRTGRAPSFYVSDVGDGVHEVTREAMAAWPSW